eukprot:162875_1
MGAACIDTCGTATPPIVKSTNVNNDRFLTYVSNLDIPKASKAISFADTEQIYQELLEEKDDGEMAAAIDAGMNVAFAPGVSKLHQSDVKNVMCLAQLAANYVANREEKVDQWYHKYREVLEQLGWTITKFAFNEWHAKGSTVQMDKVALEIIAAMITGNPLIAVTAGLDALSKLNDDDKAFDIWKSNAANGNKGNFQIATAQEDMDGNVTMSVCYMVFTTKVNRSRFLFWSWETSSIEIKYGSETIVLNEGVYNGDIRKEVIKKLGIHAHEYIQELPIAI